MTSKQRSGYHRAFEAEDWRYTSICTVVFLLTTFMFGAKLKDAWLRTTEGIDQQLNLPYLISGLPLSRAAY